MSVQVLFWVIPLLFLNRREQCFRIFRIVALEQQLQVYQRQQRGQRRERRRPGGLHHEYSRAAA